MDRSGEGETMNWAGLRGRRSERGQSAFEFAIVLPFIFLFIYVMVEGVLFLQQFTVLDHAVRDGARYAARGYKQADVKSCTVYRSGSNLTASQVSVTGASDQAGAAVGSPVKVQVQNYSYNVISSLRGLTYSIPLNSQTTMSLQSASAPAPVGAGGSVCQ